MDKNDPKTPEISIIYGENDSKNDEYQQIQVNFDEKITVSAILRRKMDQKPTIYGDFSPKQAEKLEKHTKMGVILAKTSHFYAVSAFNWAVSEDAEEAWALLRRASNEESITQNYTAQLYKVPVPVNCGYAIEWFKPQLDGVEFVEERQVKKGSFVAEQNRALG